MGSTPSRPAKRKQQNYELITEKEKPILIL